MAGKGKKGQEGMGSRGVIGLSELSEAKAIEILQEQGVLRKWEKCPYCGKRKVGLGRRWHWRCWYCGREWSPRRGSVLEKVRIRYSQFVWVVKLFELEVPASKAAKQVGLSKPTVLKLYRMIREGLAQAQRKEPPLRGEVEVDETYLGGRRKGIRGRSGVKKVAVLGLRQRGGPLRLIAVEDVSASTLQKRISRSVQRGSLLYTDRFVSYEGVERWGLIHRSLNKREEGFRKGPICLNGIEGAWGWVKVRLRRFHGIPHTSYPLFLQEMQFRFNFKGPDLFAALLQNLSSLPSTSKIAKRNPSSFSSLFLSNRAKI